jgi:simple sugar transport system ATP-binding protein
MLRHEKGGREVAASVLEMKQIAKSYGGVLALHGVDFSVRVGEVHAILGANGAGKSTLMKILSGAETADSGTIRIDGEPVLLASPRDAKRAGIHLVQQEVDTGLIPYLSVAENMLLDRTVAARGIWFSPRRTAAEAEAVLNRCGFSLPLLAKAEELTLAEKQLLLLARAIAQDVRFVIFDEPTAPLSRTETEALFALIEGLKANGMGVVYISHRLPEVFRIADKITVLRDGRKVLEKAKAATGVEEVVAAMLGKSFAEEFPKQAVPVGDVLFEAKGVGVGRKVKQFDVQLREGEIVAVVGLVGAGKTEVSRALFGADPLDRGQIFLRGRELRIGSPAEAVRHGIVLIPEERRRQGILIDEPVKDNLTLANLREYTRAGFVQAEAERQAARTMVERLGIKTAGLQLPVGRLSGGNQQKVAVGKWLLSDAQVFLFDEPTKGVDVGAKHDIFRLMQELAGEGKGILYFSSEIDEAMGIADRLIVMEGGRIVSEWERSQWVSGEVTPETVLYDMSGGDRHGSCATA